MIISDDLINAMLENKSIPNDVKKFLSNKIAKCRVNSFVDFCSIYYEVNLIANSSNILFEEFDDADFKYLDLKQKDLIMMKEKCKKAEKEEKCNEQYSNKGCQLRDAVIN